MEGKKVLSRNTLETDLSGQVNANFLIPDKLEARKLALPKYLSGCTPYHDANCLSVINNDVKPQYISLL